MRTVTLLLLSWAALLSTPTHAKPSGWQAVIDDIVASERAGTIVVGFYDEGETRMLVAGGPADADSIFEIGSISKVFTSLLTEVQVEAGNLTWGQTLAESFPDLEFANDAVAGITLRELSTHTSGLPRLPTNMIIADPDDPYAGYDRKLLLEFLAGFDPEALDKTYEYSNYGAGLLGEIAADAAGATYATAMQELVFAPLAMSSSTVGLRDEFAGRLVKGYSSGVEVANWSGFDALAGAGAITSSLNDMFTFIDNNLGDSELQAALSAIRTPQGDGTTAYGWHLQSADGNTVHWHNGGTGGYASFLGIDTKQRRGVVVLSASADYNGITELGFQLMSGTVPDLATDDFAALEGVYELQNGFYLTLFERDGRLQGQATGQAAFALTRVSPTEFRFDAASIVITFPEDVGSQAPYIGFSQGGSKTRAKRVDDDLGTWPLEEIDIDPAILSDYVGSYQLAPGAVITVEDRDGRLFAMLTGQQFFQVFPFDKDKFFYKIVDAKLLFGRDASGKVTQLTLDQNGLNVAPRIGD